MDTVFRNGYEKGNIGVVLLFALLGAIILIMILPILSSAIDIGNLSSALVTISKQGYVAFAAGEYSDIVSKLSTIISQTDIVEATSSSINITTQNTNELASSINTTVNEVNDYFTAVQYVRPNLSTGVTVTSDVSPWTLGNYATIVQSGNVTQDFEIHHIDVASLSGNAAYQIEFYYGATDTYFGAIAIRRDNPTTASDNLPIQGPIIPGNAQIRARMADSIGGNTALIKIFYHLH